MSVATMFAQRHLPHPGGGAGGLPVMPPLIHHHHHPAHHLHVLQASTGTGNSSANHRESPTSSSPSEAATTKRRPEVGLSPMISTSGRSPEVDDKCADAATVTTITPVLSPTGETWRPRHASRSGSSPCSAPRCSPAVQDDPHSAPSLTDTRVASGGRSPHTDASSSSSSSASPSRGVGGGGGGRGSSSPFGGLSSSALAAPAGRSGSSSERRLSGGAAVTVHAAADIPANVTVGPYLFDLALGLHMTDDKPSADSIQAHYGGGTLTVDGEPTPRWLAYIQAARDRHEQTLEAFRDPRGFIYYRTMRRLRAGEELLVWYGDELARECGIPVLTPANIRGDQQYVCTTCSKSYTHPNCLKSHIRFRCVGHGAPTTRLDFLVSPRAPPKPTTTPPSPDAAVAWYHHQHHHLSPPRRASLHNVHTTPRRRSSPEVHRHSPEAAATTTTATSGGPSGPMNLKIGGGSAFRPPASRRPESGSYRSVGGAGDEEVSRQQSPDSTLSDHRDDRAPAPTVGASELKQPSARVNKENSSFQTFGLLSQSETAVQSSAEQRRQREKRLLHTSPVKAVGLKHPQKVPGMPQPPSASAGGGPPQPPPAPPISSLFSHMPRPAFPFPVDGAHALKYYYTPALYNKLNSAAAAAAAGQIHCFNRMLLNHKPPSGAGGGLTGSQYLDSMYYPYPSAHGGAPHHPPHHRSPFQPPKLPVSPPGGQQQDHHHHHHHSKLEDSLQPNAGSPEAAGGGGGHHVMPFAFPLPSEKAGEPLDLLPRSLYMHKSRKGHLCIYCGKMYSRKYGLKIHLRTHTGYKPLKCKVCLRPFGDPSNLNKHIRLHAEGETPYRCEFCGKVLVRRRDLERHVKSRHPTQADKLLSGAGSDTGGAAPPALVGDNTEVAVNSSENSSNNARRHREARTGSGDLVMRTSPCFSLADSVTDDSLEDEDSSKDMIDVQEDVDDDTADFEVDDEDEEEEDSLVVDDDDDVMIHRSTTHAQLMAGHHHVVQHADNRQDLVQSEGEEDYDIEVVS